MIDCGIGFIAVCIVELIDYLLVVRKKQGLSQSPRVQAVTFFCCPGRAGGNHIQVAVLWLYNLVGASCAPTFQKVIIREVLVVPIQTIPIRTFLITTSITVDVILGHNASKP